MGNGVVVMTPQGGQRVWGRASPVKVSPLQIWHQRPSRKSRKRFSISCGSSVRGGGGALFRVSFWLSSDFTLQTSAIRCAHLAPLQQWGTKGGPGFSVRPVPFLFWSAVLPFSVEDGVSPYSRDGIDGPAPARI